MPSAWRVELTNRTWGSRVTSKTVGVTLAIAVTKIFGVTGRVLSARGISIGEAGRTAGKIFTAVLDGGVAVRCNPKPALAGLKSRSRPCVHRPTAGSAALTAWYCAA